MRWYFQVCHSFFEFIPTHCYGGIPIFCSAISHACLSILTFRCSPHASCLLQPATPAVHSPCPFGIYVPLFLYAVQLITAGFIIKCTANFLLIPVFYFCGMAQCKVT